MKGRRGVGEETTVRQVMPIVLHFSSGVFREGGKSQGVRQTGSGCGDVTNGGGCTIASSIGQYFRGNFLTVKKALFYRFFSILKPRELR